MTRDEVERSSAETWRRLAALIYDSFMLVTISMAYFALMLITHSIIFKAPEGDYLPVLDHPLYTLGWYVSLVYFYYYFWQKGGQTIGMRAWRLKLVDEGGSAATKKSCLVRALISPLCTLPLLAGYFWKYIDAEGRCLHDKFSHTRVVVIKKAR